MEWRRAEPHFSQIDSGSQDQQKTPEIEPKLSRIDSRRRALKESVATFGLPFGSCPVGRLWLSLMLQIKPAFMQTERKFHDVTALSRITKGTRSHKPKQANLEFGVET